MIVVDASVAAKWLLPEAGSSAAIGLQGGPDLLVAPDLIRLEVASAITRRVRAEKEKDRLPPDEAVARCTKWFRLLDIAILSLVPEQDILAEAVALSARIKHPLQDCLYLAVAVRFNAPLLTADDKLFKRVAGKPDLPEVLMLEGCKAN
jgi:predicted nucleic acid-binding protein